MNLLIKKCAVLRNRSASQQKMDITVDEHEFDGDKLNFSDEFKINIRSIQLAINEIKSPGFSDIFEFSR